MYTLYSDMLVYVLTISLGYIVEYHWSIIGIYSGVSLEYIMEYHWSIIGVYSGISLEYIMEYHWNL